MLWHGGGVNCTWVSSSGLFSSMLMERCLDGDAIIRATVNCGNLFICHYCIRLLSVICSFLFASLLLEDMVPSAVMTYGSHLNCSRDVMVHWPTTGFLPNGRWSITFSTIGGVYISSFGRSWMEGVEKRKNWSVKTHLEVVFQVSSAEDTKISQYSFWFWLTLFSLCISFILFSPRHLFALVSYTL